MKVIERDGKRVLVITRKEWEEMGKRQNWTAKDERESDHLERFTIEKDPQY